MDSPEKRNDLLRREAEPADACPSTSARRTEAEARQAAEARAALAEAELERLQDELARLRGETRT